ncbi:MAG: hypothetical protein U9N59_16800 [Campylobacterota bacterium]|nr:hypothetical protein [Campylobacterota bacterium]
MIQVKVSKNKIVESSNQNKGDNMVTRNFKLGIISLTVAISLFADSQPIDLSSINNELVQLKSTADGLNQKKVEVQETVKEVNYAFNPVEVLNKLPNDIQKSFECQYLKAYIALISDIGTDKTFIYQQKPYARSLVYNLVISSGNTELMKLNVFIENNVPSTFYSTAKKLKAQVSAPSGLKLRSTPLVASMNDSQIDVLTRKTDVEVHFVTNIDGKEWVFASTPSGQGYVSAEYISTLKKFSIAKKKKNKE